jgi:fibronectin-binding autotransporter adhesin
MNHINPVPLRAMIKISPPSTTPYAIWFTRLLAAAAVFLLPVSSVLAQATATWTGGGVGSSTGTSANWSGTAPVGTGERDLVFDASNVVAANRQVVTFNQSITITHLLMKREDTDTYGGFDLTGTNNSPTLKGNIDVVSGAHTNRMNLTVLTNSTWDIAEGASLLRGMGTLTFGEEYTITKTGGGLLTLYGGSSEGVGGTFLVQEGVLRLTQTNSTLSLNAATIALNGGTFDLRVNAARTNAASTTSLLGDSTLRMSRTANGEGLTQEMGALQLGSGTLRVETDDSFTSGTAGWTFGATTLSNNATVEVVNGTAALTRLSLGAVGESGGSHGLTKGGDGELELTAINTYSGATVVSDGLLIIGASGSVDSSSVLEVGSGATLDVSAVSGGFVVGSSQTLRGSGTVVGNTTINGALQPGSSPGLLSFDDNLTLASSATTTMEINGTDRGTAYDAVAVGGLLTYDGALVLSLGTTFGEGSYSFDLFDFDFGSASGSFDSVDLSGLYIGSLINNGSGVWGLTSGVDTWTFTESSGLLALEVVPEPSTYALLILAAAGLGARVIRRRHR